VEERAGNKGKKIKLLASNLVKVTKLLNHRKKTSYTEKHSPDRCLTPLKNTSMYMKEIPI